MRVLRGRPEVRTDSSIQIKLSGGRGTGAMLNVEWRRTLYAARESPLDSVDVALASSSYRSMPPSRGSHLGMLGPQILPLPSAHLRELRFGKARATSVEAREHLFHSPNSTKGSGLGMIETVRAALERSTRDLLIHHVRQPRPFAAIATRSAPNASHPDP